MRDDRAYVEHIIEAIKKIESYTENVASFDDFIKNDLVLDATIRELEIIGEASNNISKELQEKNQDIPWRQIIGIRNTLIHEYFGVNKRVVWETCQHDLKPLKKIVKSLLE